MRKVILIAAIIVAAFAAIATTQTDPLAELKQVVAGLTTRVDDHEARLAYLERRQPVDTFQPIEGAGSTAELASALNSRVPLADGIEIAVVDAEVVRGASDIRDYVQTFSDWIAPPGEHKLVKVNVNIYNTTRKQGWLELGMCPWLTYDTFATNYRGRCEETMFWNITVDGVDYPQAGPWTNKEFERGKIYDYVDEYGLYVDDVSVSESTLFFHVRAARPLDGLMTYKHPANEDSHRYWKLKRPTRKRQ